MLVSISSFWSLANRFNNHTLLFVVPHLPRRKLEQVLYHFYVAQDWIWTLVENFWIVESKIFFLGVFYFLFCFQQIQETPLFNVLKEHCHELTTSSIQFNLRDQIEIRTRHASSCDRNDQCPMCVSFDCRQEASVSPLRRTDDDSNDNTNKCKQTFKALLYQSFDKNDETKRSSEINRSE